MDKNEKVRYDDLLKGCKKRSIKLYTNELKEIVNFIEKNYASENYRDFILWVDLLERYKSSAVRITMAPSYLLSIFKYENIIESMIPSNYSNAVEWAIDRFIVTGIKGYNNNSFLDYIKFSGIMEMFKIKKVQDIKLLDLENIPIRDLRRDSVSALFRGVFPFKSTDANLEELISLFEESKIKLNDFIGKHKFNKISEKYLKIIVNSNEFKKELVNNTKLLINHCSEHMSSEIFNNLLELILGTTSYKEFLKFLKNKKQLLKNIELTSENQLLLEFY